MSRPTEAYVSANLFEVGIGHVVVARFRGHGEMEAGVFLLDVFCLGAKNALYTRVSTAEYDATLLDRLLPADNRKPIDPPTARKLIEGAVAYAQNLGLAPHPDYKMACRVLGGIKSAESTATFTFGSKGKPFYVQGLRDSVAFCHRLLNQLRARCGVDGFDFLVLANETQAEELERAGFSIGQSVPAPPGFRPPSQG
jgi:hypothetical protein